MHSKLVFKEDFVGPQLNRDDWTVEVGEKWFNQELQCYVDDPSVYEVHDGLKISAHKHPTATTCQYRSARLTTRGHQSWQYGTFKIRAKVGKGIGSWPAIWMLPDDHRSISWPRCGEIDIMETIGRQADVLHISLHTGDFNHRLGNHRTVQYPYAGLHDDFHDYILVWTKDQLSFYLDDHLVGQFNRPELVTEGNWPFDKPYHLIINMAVGGNWGGPVHDADLPFQLQIHSIEVYQ